MVEKFFPKTRFSSRVDNYLKFRPKYPRKIISFMKHKLKLVSDSVVADIGSGTGLLSILFLEHGNKVYGIEPNEDMRKAGEQYLRKYNKFYSLNASAENTSLKPNSIDFIVAGQSYHWFDHKKSKIEFKRILKSKGKVVLIWNSKSDTDNFTRIYVEIVKSHSKNYNIINNKSRKENTFIPFFSPELFYTKHFTNEQNLNWLELRGITLSFSYVPLVGSEHNALFKELKDLFLKYQINKKIVFKYKTEVIYGNLMS